MPGANSSITRAPRPSSLADVLDLILDKGLVIDAYVRVSAVGIEVLTIDARIVIASVDTYLHYAEAVNRLDLSQTETQGITGLFDGSSRGGRASNGDSGQTDSARSSSRRNGSSRRELSGGRSRNGSDHAEDDREGDDQEDGSGDDEGKGRSLARRLGEKGRWNS